MTKKDQVRGSHRINDAMLDEMLAGTDAAAMFHSGELLSELRQRLAERILDAEMELHLDSNFQRASRERQVPDEKRFRMVKPSECGFDGLDFDAVGHLG